MLRTYKYILELHHLENGEYSIIHLLSPTCTSLDNQKSKKNTIFIFNLLECILNMWLIDIITVKLKIILMLIIKFLKKFTFNILKLIYGYFFFLMTRIKNCLLYHVFTHWDDVLMIFEHPNNPIWIILKQQDANKMALNQMTKMSIWCKNAKKTLEEHHNDTTMSIWHWNDAITSKQHQVHLEPLWHHWNHARMLKWHWNKNGMMLEHLDNARANNNNNGMGESTL
jgi:hypothetical protein